MCSILRSDTVGEHCGRLDVNTVICDLRVIDENIQMYRRSLLKEQVDRTVRQLVVARRKFRLREILSVKQQGETKEEAHLQEEKVQGKEESRTRQSLII